MSSINRESLVVGEAGASVPCVREGARKLRVLIVDDNHDCANSLSTLVNLWGYNARTAYDGVAALAMMGVRQPNVVLLDLSMPRMDGCQMARQIRRQTRFDQTLLIAITGWTDQAHRLLCDEAGFDHYLIKPIELADLETLLRHERLRLTQLVEENDPAQEIHSGQMKTEVLSCWC
jgi:DNA-binding response OmpR family regulator